jgi:uncharacterized protein YwgA
LYRNPEDDKKEKLKEQTRSTTAKKSKNLQQAAKLIQFAVFRDEEEEEANLNKCFREVPKILFRTDANSRRFQRI